MNLFVSNATYLALKRYIDYKEKRDYSYASDFLVYVINVLIYIYNEADIINPYMTKEDHVWKNNLLKYGLDDKWFQKFISDLDNYYALDLENKKNKYQDKNPFFSYVQEDLIDAFLKKYQVEKMNALELDNFKKMLFSPNSSSQFQRDINKIMALNENEVDEYYASKIYALNNVISYELIKKNILDESIYKAFNIDIDRIINLPQSEIDEINQKITSYFKMSPIEPHLNEKLLKETKKISKYANNSGRINIIMFLLLLGLVIAIGLYIAYRMVG